MKLRSKALAIAVTLFVTGTVAPEASASTDSEFRAAVARVLTNVKNETEFLRNLSSSEFRSFVSCAQNIMDAAPRPRKEFVLAASNLSEQRKRFDQVALDNRAALKQKIAQECQP